LSAHNLANQVIPGLAIGNSVQAGTHAPIRLNAMTARTVHLENGVSLDRISLDLQHALDIGIDIAKSVNRDRHQDADQQDNQQGQGNSLNRRLIGQ